MRIGRRISRRDFLTLIGPTLGAGLLGSCGILPKPTPETVYKYVDVTSTPLPPVMKVVTPTATQNPNLVSARSLISNAVQQFEIDQPIVGRFLIQGDPLEMDLPEIRFNSEFFLDPGLINLPDISPYLKYEMLSTNRELSSRYAVDPNLQLAADIWQVFYKAWQHDNHDIHFYGDREKTSFGKYLHIVKDGSEDVTFSSPLITEMGNTMPNEIVRLDPRRLELLVLFDALKGSSQILYDSARSALVARIGLLTVDDPQVENQTDTLMAGYMDLVSTLTRLIRSNLAFQSTGTITDFYRVLGYTANRALTPFLSVSQEATAASFKYPRVKLDSLKDAKIDLLPRLRDTHAVLTGGELRIVNPSSTDWYGFDAGPIQVEIPFGVEVDISKSGKEYGAVSLVGRQSFGPDWWNGVKQLYIADTADGRGIEIRDGTSENGVHFYDLSQDFPGRFAMAIEFPDPKGKVIRIRRVKGGDIVRDLDTSQLWDVDLADGLFPDQIAFPGFLLAGNVSLLARRFTLYPL